MLQRDTDIGFSVSVFWVNVFCVCVFLCVSPHRGGVALCAGGGDGGDMIDDGREVCGSRESQLRHHHPVGFNDPLNT